jgi:hypothetical protein
MEQMALAFDIWRLELRRIEACVFPVDNSFDFQCIGVEDDVIRREVIVTEDEVRLFPVTHSP